MKQLNIDDTNLTYQEISNALDFYKIPNFNSFISHDQSRCVELEIGLANWSENNTTIIPFFINHKNGICEAHICIKCTDIQYLLDMFHKYKKLKAFL